MKIGLDLDDVIVELFPPFLDWYNRELDKNIPIESLTSFYLWECGIGQDKDELIELMGKFFNGLNGNSSFSDGARKGLRSLVQNGAELEIITSRPAEYLGGTRYMFRENLINPEIYFTDGFQGGGRTKALIAKERSVDIYFDDCLDYVVECLEAGVNAYLFDQPWNQIDDMKSFPLERRIYGWNGILKKIEESR
jgi:uncharacterized HAD superfamily protein